MRLARLGPARSRGAVIALTYVSNRPVSVGGGSKMSASKPPLETNGKIPQTYPFSLGMQTSMNALTDLFIGDVILLSVGRP